MITINGISEIPDIENAVVTSGTFDGVHLGHQTILKQIDSASKEINGKSVVITFWPHPRFVLSSNHGDLKLLSTFEERVELLEQAGIDYLIKIDFTLEFSQMSSQDFIQDILIEKIKTKQLIIGYDHKFGKNREGSFESIQSRAKDYGFTVTEISKKDILNQSVSSSEVRKALQEGRVNDASQLLGSYYSLSGNVVGGRKIGTEIGFPTANLQIAEEYKLIPKNGVYAVKVRCQNEHFNGMLNIGHQPTVNGDALTIEVNLFDTNRDLYGEILKIEFVERLRDEKKFNSLDELTTQLTKDKEKSNSILIEV